MIATEIADKSAAGTERFTAVDQVMMQFDYQEHALIEVLIAAQETYGCLTRDLMEYVAKKLHLSLIRVYSVATFYDMFTLDEVGETECTICTGPACKLAGAEDVLAEVNIITGKPERGQRNGDGKYLIKESPCLGFCDQAPAALVNRKAQVSLTASGASAMLKGMAQAPRFQISGDPRVLTGPIGHIGPTDLEGHRCRGSLHGAGKSADHDDPHGGHR